LRIDWTRAAFSIRSWSPWSPPGAWWSCGSRRGTGSGCWPVAASRWRPTTIAGWCSATPRS